MLFNHFFNLSFLSDREGFCRRNIGREHGEQHTMCERGGGGGGREGAEIRVASKVKKI